MVRVVGPLLAADDVAPPSADAVACLDVDDLVGMRPRDSAAELRVVDVVNRVGLRWSTEADELALLSAVDREFLSTSQRHAVVEAVVDVRLLVMSLGN
jgi:hypothetical protein